MLKAMLTLEKILPIILGGLLMFGFDLTYIAILTLLAAFLHESAHVFSLALFKCKEKNELSGHLFGIKLRADELSYQSELIVALSGPLSNIIVGALCLIPKKAVPTIDYLRVFGAINIATAVTNLLPIEGYDGYRILRCFLMLAFNSPYVIDTVLYWLSVAVASSLCFLSLYFLLKMGEGYWIFAIFFFVLLSLITKRLKTTK